MDKNTVNLDCSLEYLFATEEQKEQNEQGVSVNSLIVMLLWKTVE